MKMIIYVVIELHEACSYGDAFADVTLFNNKEDAEQYAKARKPFANCRIEEKEVL